MKLKLVLGLFLFCLAGIAVGTAFLRASWTGLGSGGSRPSGARQTSFERLPQGAVCGSRLPRAAARRPRPPDTPAAESTEELAPNAMQLFNGYGHPESVYRTSSVVVHYVTRGVNAPPLNDDDGDGVPDYVERAAAAADEALTHFAAAGYRSIRPDTGGPNALPDIYVSRFTPGYFGVALPATRARGGAFVAIANWLDPSPTRSLASLVGTVAHELFHLIQFSYFAPGADLTLPAWVQEGTAGGLEGRVCPDLDDVLWHIQMRDWLTAPSRSITTSPYGAEILWNYVDRVAPHVVPTLMSALARRPNTDPLSALRAVCGHNGSKPFAQLFHDFAVATYAAEGDELNPTGWVTAARARVSVGALSLQYLRLPTPSRLGYTLTVEMPSPVARTHASVVYRLRVPPGANPKVVRPKPTASGARSVTWRVRPSTTIQDLSVLLTSPSLTRGTTYLVRLAKVGGAHPR